jgi:hypothetical protein
MEKSELEIQEYNVTSKHSPETVPALVAAAAAD